MSEWGEPEPHFCTRRSPGEGCLQRFSVSKEGGDFLWVWLFFFKFPFSPISNVINSRVLEMDQIMLVHGLICDSYSVTDAIAGFSTIKTHTFCYIVCRLFASCISDWELVSVIRVATSKRLILLPPVSQGSLFHWRKTVNVFSKIQGLAKKLQFRIHYWWWMWSP